LEVSLNVLKYTIKENDIIQEIARKSLSGKVYLVGGAIREMFLKKTPNDYDLALTDEKDLKILETLFERPSFILGKKPIQTHRIMADDTSFDITIVEGTIEEDLKRRDFTMNAIAYDINNDVIVDTLGGLEDIQKMIIRYPAKETISNDPLRMLKAVRHFANLDGFTLDDALLQSIKEMKHLIHEVAPERIKYELDHIIVSHRVADGMEMLEETGLLFEIFPELYALRLLDIEKQFELETLGHTLDGFRFLHHYNNEFFLDEKVLRNVGYGFLFHDLGKANTYYYDEKKGNVHFFYHERVSREMASRIMERLRFSANEMNAILALIESHMRIFLISDNEPRERAVRRLVYKMGDLTPSLILHSMCDMYGSSGGIDNPSTEEVKKCCEEILEAYKESLKKPLPKLLNGHDLISLGFVQGPAIGSCLDDIREKQITGEMTDCDQAREYARNFLKDMQNSE
jgi:tRNA nucleotidyltransferase/poly(A) polymerase